MIWHLSFGDLSQSEKKSDIKPPLIKSTGSFVAFLENLNCKKKLEAHCGMEENAKLELVHFFSIW